jgi:protein SCO1/2
VNARVLLALVLVAVASVAFVVVSVEGDSDGDAATAAGQRFEGALLPEGVPAPELRGLRDENGDVPRMADLRGEPVIVTFLYSNCEDTCPAQAQQVKGALNELGEDVPSLAISVDPANDTAESARAFLSKQRMTGRMRFLLGSRAELERVWKGYAISPQRDDLEHTARVVLVDRRGMQRIGYPFDKVTPEGLAHDIRLLAAGR